MATGRVIGAGPNGLAAAITLARARVETTLFERNERLGGGLSTAETTLPGFRHDLGSSVYPMGRVSPFFRSLPMQIPWIDPGAPCAHPLDDGTAVMLARSIRETTDQLEACDRKAYRSLMEPLADGFEALLDDILGADAACAENIRCCWRGSGFRDCGRRRRWLRSASRECGHGRCWAAWRRTR